MIKKNQSILHYAIIVVVSFIISFIFLNNKILNEQDTFFHANRLLSLSNVFVSPNNFLTFGGFGKIITTFYPSITIMIYQLFYLVTNSFSISVKLLVLMFVIISGCLSYFSVKNITTNNKKALIFALLYMSSQYFLANIYIRFSLGEFAAFSFLPLVLLGWKKLFFCESKKFYFLTIGISLIVYSHILSAILLVAFTIVIAGVSFTFNNKSWDKQRWLSLMYFIIFTFLLTCVIFIPLVEQLKANKIYTTFTISTFTNQTYGLLNFIKVNSSNNLIYYPLGSIVIVGFVFSIFSFKKLDLFARIILVLSLVLIIMQLSIFPWKIFDNSKFLFIQFLFRLNSFIILFVFYVFANSLVDNKFSKFDVLKYVFVTLWVFVNSLIAMQHYVTHNVKTLQNAYHDDKFYKKQAKRYFNFDYSNQAQVWFKPTKIDSQLYENDKGKKLLAKLSLLPKTNKLIENNKFINAHKSVSESNLKYSYYAKNENSTLILPVTLYKGIEIKVNNEVVKPLVSRLGTTQISFKGKRFVNINITYHYTLISRLCQFTALISWLILLAVIFDLKSLIFKNK